MAGCGSNFKPGTESLLEGLNTTITPGELATMAIDPYDPNNRYVGTLGLANETFANEPVYIKLFEDNLKDPEPSVRFAAARGLGNHGDPSHVPLLVKVLSDPDRLVRMESARSLQGVHNPVSIEPLIAAMHEPDATRPKDPSEPEAIVRAEAAIALGQYQEQKVLQVRPWPGLTIQSWQSTRPRAPVAADAHRTGFPDRSGRMGRLVGS